MTTFSELAGEAYDWFQRKTRQDDESFYTFKDDAPEWLSDLVREAHGSMLPDDWRYEAIHSALGHIHDSGADTPDDTEDAAHEFADANVDIYNSARTAWLHSNLYRAAYCDDALTEFGDIEDTFQLIGLGQYNESREVFESVRQSLADRWEELEDED